MDVAEETKTVRAAAVELGAIIQPPATIAPDLARLLYLGYRAHTGGKSLATGQPIPDWDGLRPDIQEAWTASACVALLFAWGPEVVL